MGSVALKPTVENWGTEFEAFLKTLQQPKVSFLFLLDEFTFLIDNVMKRSAEEGVAVLRTFRAVRHQLYDGRVRFMLTGSAGLQHYLGRLGLQREINDLDTFTMPSLTPAEAETLIRGLATGEKLELRDDMVEEIQTQIHTGASGR